MKHAVRVKENIYWIGVNDFDTTLFEGLWPLPHGICYNSYIIVDEKVALIDTVKRAFLPHLLEKIKPLLKNGKTIDYLVVNHMEPDHSGAINIFCDLFPQMKIICNQRTVDFLSGFYGIKDNLIIVKDLEEISLGKTSLKFYLTPMVHWPETMMTFESKNGILFSGDAFGGFGALTGGIFDDEVDLSFYDNEILRYYSNIVAKYSPMVQRAIAKLKDVPIKAIAPTHGPIFRTNPKYILDHYICWSNQNTEKGIVIVYASMYGHTQTMAEAVARAVSKSGIGQIRIHNVSRSNLSFILTDIWRYKGLILGSSTYNMMLNPLMEMLVSILENDKLQNRVMGIFGSYSWSGGAVTRLKKFADQSGIPLMEPVVEAKHSPCEADLLACRKLGRAVARAL